MRVTGNESCGGLPPVFQNNPQILGSLVAFAQNTISRSDPDVANATLVPNQVKPVVVTLIGRVPLLFTKPTWLNALLKVSTNNARVSLKVTLVELAAMVHGVVTVESVVNVIFVASW